MSWVNSKQFTISNRNGRHYVFRRNNAGNAEINIPLKITTKAQARMWLKEHPNKVAAPNRYRSKRKPPVPVIKQNQNYFMNILRAKGEKHPWKMTCDVLRKTLKVRTVLGKGRQGIVYFASRYSNKRCPFAIKIVPRDLNAVKRSEPQPALCLRPLVAFVFPNLYLSPHPPLFGQMRRFLLRAHVPARPVCVAASRC